MATIINADNGSVSGSAGLKQSSDASGVLALQTNGTTAVTVNASQAVGVGSTPSYGTTGQVLTSAGSGAAPTWSTISTPAGGKVLQVVQGTKTGNSYTISGTYVSTNLYATITPSSTSSRIMVIATSHNIYNQTGGLQVALYRGTGGNGSGTNIATLGTSSNIGASFGIGATLNWIDSPASTSALTYTIMNLSVNGSSLVGFCGELAGTSSIILLEIAA